MGNSLSSGVSGLKAHEQMLDIIGNNLANLNTPGFKARRIVFRDLVYSTLIPATKAADGFVGGTNPIQLGSGVETKSVEIQTAQGKLEATGGVVDFALEGAGYFVLNDGARQLFTRSGSFSLDESGNIVDPSTGFRVQRIGSTGEADGVLPGFQTPGDRGIRIPFGATIPGQPTTSAILSGNLPAFALGPRAEVLTSISAYTSGGLAATGSTLLNSLDKNSADYSTGDMLDISGVGVNGSTVSASIAVDATTTMSDLVAAINSAFPNATATLGNDGNISLTSNIASVSAIQIEVKDRPGNVGVTDFFSNRLLQTTPGHNGDLVENSVEVFDPQGGAHIIGITFRKIGVNEWELTGNISPESGTLTDGLVQRITFNDDGSFRQVNGTGLGNSEFVVKFKDFDEERSIAINLGKNKDFNGLTQVSAQPSLSVQQDGFESGTVNNISISASGLLQAESSNSLRFPIAQLAIAKFRNEKGLEAVGGGFFVETPSTGAAEIGTGRSGGRGIVRGGQLEASNVDIAIQFTNLIVAQRGFSANARTITITDEILEELTNLVR